MSDIKPNSQELSKEQYEADLRVLKESVTENANSPVAIFVPVITNFTWEPALNGETKTIALVSNYGENIDNGCIVYNPAYVHKLAKEADFGTFYAIIATIGLAIKCGYYDYRNGTEGFSHTKAVQIMMSHSGIFNTIKGNNAAFNASISALEQQFEWPEYMGPTMQAFVNLNTTAVQDPNDPSGQYTIEKPEFTDDDWNLETIRKYLSLALGGKSLQSMPQAMAGAMSQAQQQAMQQAKQQQGQQGQQGGSQQSSQWGSVRQQPQSQGQQQGGQQSGQQQGGQQSPQEIAKQATEAAKEAQRGAAACARACNSKAGQLAGRQMMQASAKMMKAASDYKNAAESGDQQGMETAAQNMQSAAQDIQNAKQQMQQAMKSSGAKSADGEKAMESGSSNCQQASESASSAGEQGSDNGSGQQGSSGQGADNGEAVKQQASKSAQNARNAAAQCAKACGNSQDAKNAQKTIEEGAQKLEEGANEYAEGAQNGDTNKMQNGVNKMKEGNSKIQEGTQKMQEAFNKAMQEGGQQGGDDGSDQGGKQGGKQGGQQGGEQGGEQGGDEGFPGSQGGNQGGKQGGKQGGDDGSDQGGDEGFPGSQGGQKGGQKGGKQGGQQGGDDGEGGDPQIDYIPTKGGQKGGKQGGQQGGQQGGDDGDESEWDDEGFPGGDEGFPGSRGGQKGGKQGGQQGGDDGDGSEWEDEGFPGGLGGQQGGQQGGTEGFPSNKKGGQQGGQQGGIEGFPGSQGGTSASTQEMQSALNQLQQAAQEAQEAAKGGEEGQGGGIHIDYVPPTQGGKQGGQQGGDEGFPGSRGGKQGGQQGGETEGKDQGGEEGSNGSKPNLGENGESSDPSGSGSSSTIGNLGGMQINLMNEIEFKQDTRKITGMNKNLAEFANEQNAFSQVNKATTVGSNTGETMENNLQSVVNSIDTNIETKMRHGDETEQQRMQELNALSNEQNKADVSINSKAHLTVARKILRAAQAAQLQSDMESGVKNYKRPANTYFQTGATQMLEDEVPRVLIAIDASGSMWFNPNVLVGAANLLSSLVNYLKMPVDYAFWDETCDIPRPYTGAVAKNLANGTRPTVQKYAGKLQTSVGGGGTNVYSVVSRLSRLDNNRKPRFDAKTIAQHKLKFADNYNLIIIYSDFEFPDNYSIPANVNDVKRRFGEVRYNKLVCVCCSRDGEKDTPPTFKKLLGQRWVSYKEWQDAIDYYSHAKK